MATQLDKIKDLQKRYLKDPPNSTDKLLDFLGTTKGNGSESLKYLRTKVLEVATKLEPKMSAIIKEQTIKALGCSQEQTYKGLPSNFNPQLTPLSQTDGIYIPVESIDLFSNAMAKHIKEKLKYPEKAMNQNIQGRTNVYFIITSEGNISDIYAVNAHPLLQLEGIRTIELLPKFIPGTIDGEAIGVSYAQPMTFKIQ